MNNIERRRTMSLEEIKKNLKKFEGYLNNKKEEDIITIINYIIRGIVGCGLIVIGGSYLLETIINNGSIITEYIKNNLVAVTVSSLTLVSICSFILSLIKINDKTKKYKKGLAKTEEQLFLAGEELKEIVQLGTIQPEKVIRHLVNKSFNTPNPDLETEHYTSQPETIDTTIYVGLPAIEPSEQLAIQEHRRFIHELTSRPFEEQLIIIGENKTYKENIPNYRLYELTEEQRKAVIDETDIFFKTEIATDISYLTTIPGINDYPQKKHIKKRILKP